MKPLFEDDGQAALARTLQHRPLLAFDFDGTLAPIVPQPDDASVPPAVTDRLERLAAMLPVAVITGRRVDDVRKRLGFAPAFVVGNHGAEDPADLDAPDHVHALDAARTSLQAHTRALHAAGVWIEDKGASIALHYRHAPDPAAAQALVMQLVAPLAPALAVVGGKMVVNLIGAGAPDKADALAALVARSGATAAIFVGDDVNDEPVFARSEPSWLTIRVGRDLPPSRAMFFVEDTHTVAALLDCMLALLPPRA